jgi:hypothetical protein
VGSVRVRPDSFRKRDFAQAVSGPLKSGAEDLLRGVLLAFPKADEGRLETWLGGLRRWPRVEREAVLFVALVCGTRFGIYHPRVNEVLRQLWEWFTWSPRSMPKDLADLMVDALAPRLEKELRAREGWGVGPSGARGKKPGRPPASRAAWVAALVSETYLRDKGLEPADATEKALELAALLTGRKMTAAEELRAARRTLGNLDLKLLCGALGAQFEWSVAHDGVRSSDPPPGSDPLGNPSAWKRRHAPLPHLLAQFGAQSLAEEILQRIPASLWGSQGRSSKRQVPKRSRKPQRQVPAVAGAAHPKRSVPK